MLKWVNLHLGAYPRMWARMKSETEKTLDANINAALCGILVETHARRLHAELSAKRRNTSARFRESRNRTSHTPISKRQTLAIGHHEHGE